MTFADGAAVVAGFLVALVATLSLGKCATRCGMIAHPAGHRFHESPTPLIGGVAMFLGLSAAWLINGGPPVLWSCGLIVVLAGVWDDIHELSTGARFIAQIGAAMVMIYWGDVVLHDLGFLVSEDSRFYLGRWAVALSIFGSVGLMNAINMSDGMDGLAASLTAVSVLAMLIAAWLQGLHQIAVEFAILLSVLVAFLVVNVRSSYNRTARVFMGDAGSLLLGLVLAWYVIELTQAPYNLFKPVTALWIVALPLFDAVSSLLRRAVKRESPFGADRNHYHHYLLASGLSVNQVLLLSVAASALCAVVGLAGEYAGVPERYMFYLFLSLFGVYLVSIEWAQRRIEADNLS